MQSPFFYEVIPIINTLTQVFDEAINNTLLHPAVCHVALWGVCMLSKYYAKTDENIVYWIAMSRCFVAVDYLNTYALPVLHPY